MTCPICGAKTKVADTYSDVDMVIRRRKCTECDHMFWTEEIETARRVTSRYAFNIRKKGLD